VGRNGDFLMHGLIKFFDALALIPMFILGFVLVAALGEKPEPPAPPAVETPAVEAPVVEPPVIEQPIEEKPAMVDAVVTVKPASVGQEIMVQP
jgi:hypothetical protein